MTEPVRTPDKLFISPNRHRQIGQRQEIGMSRAAHIAACPPRDKRGNKRCIWELHNLKITRKAQLSQALKFSPNACKYFICRIDSLTITKNVSQSTAPFSVGSKQLIEQKRRRCWRRLFEPSFGSGEALLHKR